MVTVEASSSDLVTSGLLALPHENASSSPGASYISNGTENLSKWEEYDIKLLDRQNPSLDMAKKNTFSHQGGLQRFLVTFVFLVFDQVLNSIRDSGGKVHVSLWKASIVIVQKENSDAPWSCRLTSTTVCGHGDLIPHLHQRLL